MASLLGFMDICFERICFTSVILSPFFRKNRGREQLIPWLKRHGSTIPKVTTSHLKKVFCPNICVGHEFQILEIQPYSSGLKFTPNADIGTKDFFEIASINKIRKYILSNFSLIIEPQAEIEYTISENLVIVERENDYAVYNKLFGNFALMCNKGYNFLRSFAQPRIVRWDDFATDSNLTGYLKELIDNFDADGLFKVAKKHHVKMIGLILDLDANPYNNLVVMNKIIDAVLLTCKLSSKHGIPVTGYWHQIFEQLIGTTPHFIKKGYKTCVAEGCKISVEPNGSVGVCKCCSRKLGHIDNLKDVFNTSAYKTYAMKAFETTPECRGCEIEGFCSGLCVGILEKAFDNASTCVKSICDVYLELSKRLIMSAMVEQVDAITFKAQGADH